MAVATTLDLAKAEKIGFTWADYPGDPARGIPPGDYTTPVKNQNTSFCPGGCAIFSGVGALEMQFKIEQRNPELTLFLDEGDLYSGYILPNVDGWCSGDCTNGYRHKCVLNGLRDRGVSRFAAYDFKYRISSYQDHTGIVINPTLLHAALQNGPIVTNMKVSGTSSDLTSCGTNKHGIIIIGYEYNTVTGEMYVHVKNSWGDKTSSGFDLYPWIPAGVCSMGVYVSRSISGVYVDPSPGAHPFDADGDGILDYIDMCLGQANVSNRNLDGDYKGDECDIDIDNDLVLDIDDCDPLNKYIAYDLDSDGHCDDFWFGCEANNCPVTRAVTEYCSYDGPWLPQHAGACCIEECDRLDDMDRSDFDYVDCLDRCTFGLDNCSPDLSVDECWRVHHCLTQQGLSASCNSTYIGFTQVNRPQVGDLDNCQALSFNNGQKDTNGIWPGDRCETRVLNLVVDPGPSTPVGGLMCLRDTYRVELRANSEIYDPFSMPEERTQRGTSIESCHCNFLENTTLGLDWDPQCKVFYCKPDRREDWNPIRAPAFGDDPYTHPYGGTLSFSDDSWYRALLTIDQEMARDREVEFSRSTSDIWWPNGNNLYTFHWDWPNTKVYPRPWPAGSPASPVTNPQDHELLSVGQATLPLKVRVSWTPTVVGQDGQLMENQVLLSRGVFMITGEHMCPLDPSLSITDTPRWLAPNAPITEALLRQPRPLGWAMMRSEAGENVVVSFDRSLAEPTQVREATYLAGTPAEDRFTDGPTTAARLDPTLLPTTVDPGPRQAGKATALLAYTSDLPSELTDSEVPPALAPGGSARLWIGLVRRPDNLWLTASQALGDAAGQAPALAAPQLLFDSQTQALYLLGHEVEGGGVVGQAHYVHNVVWRLALGSGTWQRLGQVETLGRTVGYSASFDPVKRRAVIFGGVQDGQPSERLELVDLATLRSRTLWTGEGLTGVTHARERHGAYLDPVGRQLYVYGGSRAGAPLSDAEAFHLVASSWITLWAGGAGGPGERYRPMVLYDRRRSKLWVAGGSASETEPTLRPWELDPQRAEWVVRPSLSALPPADPDSLEHTFSPDAPPRYLIEIDEAAPLPGEVRLVEVSSDDPNLVLRVTDTQGRELAADERVVADHRVVLLGQGGESYLARVEAGPGYESGRTVPFTYSEGPAELVWAGDLDGLWNVTGLEVMGNHVYVGHGTSVSAVDVTDPSQPVVVGTVHTGGLVQEITRCGPRRLCVAQTFGAQSLRLIDVSDPAHPVVTGGLTLPGPCRSVAAKDTMAYLACGVSGLHLVSVLDPAAPLLLDTWTVHGIPVDVKVRGGLVAVGLFTKKVKVFRLGVASGPVLMATEHTVRRPVQLYLDGRRLHVAEVGPMAGLLCLAGIRCGFGDRVEVLELDEPAQTLIVLGDYTGPWARVPFARGLRDLILAPNLTGLRVYRAAALP